MFIFLDESGNFNKKDGKYFLVVSYTVGDIKRVEKAFRRWQNTKFPRRLKYRSEVKFSDPELEDRLRLTTLQHLVRQDCRIFYTYLKIKNVPEQYHTGDGRFKTGLLYTEIVGETLELYLPVTELEVRVFRDQRLLKGITKFQFDEHLRVRLLPELPAKINLQIASVDSTTKAAIQVADWFCGALARYHENKPMGKEFYSVLSGNIVKQKELFSDYWTQNWHKDGR